MNLKIEIKSTEIINSSGTSKAGKPYSIDSQLGYAYIANKPYPVEIRINVKQAYAPGFYKLSDDCFYVDRFGKINIEIILVSMAQSKT